MTLDRFLLFIFYYFLPFYYLFQFLKDQMFPKSGAAAAHPSPSVFAVLPCYHTVVLHNSELMKFVKYFKKTF